MHVPHKNRSRKDAFALPLIGSGRPEGTRIGIAGVPAHRAAARALPEALR